MQRNVSIGGSALNGYAGHCRFKPSKAKAIIAGVLRSKLTGAAYNPDDTSAWAREIADEVKQQLKSKY